MHSGDATIVHPPQKVYMATEHKIIQIMNSLARHLQITGPFNIQFLVKDNKVYVIELNARASRTFPFISKVTGVNFADFIVASFYGKSKPRLLPYVEHVAVKSPQFSFSRLSGADPVLRVEMWSTGEVACFGKDLESALLLSVMASTGLNVEKRAALLSLGGSLNKERFLETAKELSGAGFTLYATKSTHAFLKENSVVSELVYKVYEGQTPSVVDLIQEKKVAFVINLSDSVKKSEEKRKKYVTDGYLIRRSSVDCNIPLFTDLQLSKVFVNALTTYALQDLEIKSWKEYLN